MLQKVINMLSELLFSIVLASHAGGGFDSGPGHVSLARRQLGNKLRLAGAVHVCPVA
jgi:hypothetical protein